MWVEFLAQLRLNTKYCLQGFACGILLIQFLIKTSSIISWSIVKILHSVRVLNIGVQMIAEFKGFFTECFLCDTEQFLCHPSERPAEQQVMPPLTG